MEPEEEDLAGFQKNLSEILKSLSYSCSLSHKTFEKLHNKLGTNHELDVNMIEDAGIKLLSFLSNLRGNTAVIMKTLENYIAEVNQNRNETLFEELSTKLSVWRSSVVNINENNEFTFTQLCDKDTMVDESIFENKETPESNHLSPCTSDLDQTRSPQDSIIFIDNISEDSLTTQNCSPILADDVVRTSIHNEPSYINNKTGIEKGSIKMSLKKFDQSGTENTNDPWDSNLKTLGDVKNEIPNEQSNGESDRPRRSICLSLKTEPNLSDTQNTDDDWNDTLERNSNIRSFEKSLVKLPKKEEEDDFDMETIQLNQDQDDILDDSFADLKMEPSQSFVLKNTDEFMNLDKESPLIPSDEEDASIECPVNEKDATQQLKEFANSVNDNITNDIQSYYQDGEEKNNSLEIDDQTRITSDSGMENGATAVIEDEMDMLSTNEVADKLLEQSEIPSSPLACNENDHSNQSKPSSSKCSEGKPIHKENSDIDKVFKVPGVSSKESDSCKKIMYDDSICSNDQIENTDSSDEDLYNAPTQKISKKANMSDSHIENIDNNVEDENLSLNPTQKLITKIASSENTDKSAIVHEVLVHANAPESQNAYDLDEDKTSVPISDDNCLIGPPSKVRKMLDCSSGDETDVDSEYMKKISGSTPKKSASKLMKTLESSNNKIEVEKKPSSNRSLNVPRKLDSSISGNLDTVTNNLEIDPKGDDSVLNDDTVDNLDIRAKESGTQNIEIENVSGTGHMTEPEIGSAVVMDGIEDQASKLSDIQCQNHNVSSPTKSISSVADEDDNPFSVETLKFDSDEETDRSTGFLNDHSYSCASASDLEDSFKEPFKPVDEQVKSNKERQHVDSLVNKEPSKIVGSGENEIPNNGTSKRKNSASKVDGSASAFDIKKSFKKSSTPNDVQVGPNQGKQMGNSTVDNESSNIDSESDINGLESDEYEIHNGETSAEKDTQSMVDGCASTPDMEESFKGSSISNNEKVGPNQEYENKDATIDSESLNKDSEPIINGLGSGENELHKGKEIDSEHMVDSCYIHSEHNYSSPGLLSDTEYLENNASENDEIANDCDSDITDIDRVTKDNLWEISDSQDGTDNDADKDNSAELDMILDSQTDNIFFSQESNKSYEFDVTENVNHLVDEESDTITQRSSSRSSRIIDECDSNLSNGSSRRIDDFDDENVSNDEIDAFMANMDNEKEVSKQNELDDCDKENVSNDGVNGLICEIDTGDEVSKQNNPDDCDKENLSNDGINGLLCDIDTEDEVSKQNNPDDGDGGNISKAEVDGLLCKIANEKDVSKQNDQDEGEGRLKNVQEATCENTPESSDIIEEDDIVKELENMLNGSSKETNDGDGIDKLHTKEDCKGQSDKDKDVKDESENTIVEDGKENDLEETIIIENENTKESLMDMIMEEFLSDTEKVRKNDDSEETIILDCENIKIESDGPDIQVSEGNIDIGDEILSLLKEVQSPKTSNERNVNSEDDVEAEEILKMLQESSSDQSDSESTDDCSLSSSDSSVEIVEVDKQITIPDDRVSQILKEYNMVNCFVQLEKLKLSQGEIENHQKKLEDNWEWLCDLTNLQNKRKNPSPVPFEETKRHRKKRKGVSCDQTDLAGSSTDSDVEMSGYRSGTPVLPQHLENKLDDILANSICKELRRDGNSSSESSEDDDDSATKKKKKGNGDEVENKGSSEDKSKRVLSKEELKKKAWKNDPLLRGRLSSHSESDESKTSNSNRRRKKTRYEKTDISIDSDKLDSDSDADVYKKNKSKLEEKEISPIKRNIPVSDTSDSDSDIEFVPQKMKTPVKAESDELGPGSSQKGRRNIRALMSEDALAEATQKAKKEELERIERLKERDKVIETLSQSFSMTQSEEPEVNPLFLDVDEKSGEPTIHVHNKVTAKLKDHQRIGIQFMWDSCYESVERLQKHDGSGCILAHCMGLGKTFQVLALVHTLFNHEVTKTKHVLVICPLSTVSNWKKEVKWAFKGIPEHKNFSVFTIATRKENTNKYEIVKKWRLRKKALLVLGYEGFETLTNDSKLDKLGPNLKSTMLESLMDPGPDLVVCDEGHLLRNKNALKSIALNKIRTKRRIVLTGTPLQNNLNEYYHMVQIVKPNLLGNAKEFKTNFVNPITNGQYEDSTEEDIRLMMKRTHVLHRLLGKTVQRIEDSELELYLPKMVDHAVFVQLTQTQIDFYNHFSELVKRKPENKNTKGFLSDFQIFQYICTHPQLLAVMDKLNKKKIKERDLITNEDEPAICTIEGWWKDKLPVDSESNIDYGNKLVVMKSIIEECEEIGDKVLVFSQCLGELDLIEHFLKTFGTRKCASWQKKVDYYRMDGTVSPEDRSFICDKFNNPDNSRIRLLLMSTKVGGLGLNLTAANRVIIMTVNWNPSYDTQSVFRVYRFGQKKAVYVYRLIALDTMEEKVYQRGVTKLAIAHRVVDKHQITNHYQRENLQELYTCKPNADNERPTPNVPEDQILAILILRLPFIFKYHEHKALLANRPEINLSKEELAAAWQAWKDFENTPKPAPPPPKSSVPTTPQKPVQTGPDFNNAYSLGRNNINILANLNRNLPLLPTAEQVKQYYVPVVQANGVYRPQVMNFPNPYSNQYNPNGNQLNISTKDPLYLPTSVNQADKLSSRMWSYTSDQNKNIRLPAPPLTRLPAPKQTTVSVASSVSKDNAETIQVGTPRTSTISVANRLPAPPLTRLPAPKQTTVSVASSVSKDNAETIQVVTPRTSTISVANRLSAPSLMPVAANSSGSAVNRTDPIVIDTSKPSAVVLWPPTTITNGYRLQPNRFIPVNTGIDNKRNAETPKLHLNPASETKLVQVRKPQYSSPKPKLTVVPTLVPSKFAQNPNSILRINPTREVPPLTKHIVVPPKCSNIVPRKIMKENTGPNPANRVLGKTKNTDQNGPSTSSANGNISNGNITSKPTAKRKLEQLIKDDVAKKMKATVTPRNKNRNQSAKGMRGKVSSQNAIGDTINLVGAEDKVSNPSSDSASLSNELLKTLGQSGVTIRKVTNAQDIITLD
ncbi:unnamed protein product [Phaedon cochleariae]|uniref:Uncharacterized protein n=1 Tax=Phaedon cochleariae TaxID=80249 RepID=A0A9P0DD23_PHACE|nr:unnamed protein product [Phaedon cochleariae]